MLNRSSFDRRTAASSLLAWAAPVLLLVAAAGLYSGVNSMRSSSNRAESAADALTQVVALLSIMEDAETGQRGFLLTGDPIYLEPYEHAVAVLPEQMAKAAALASSDQVRQRLDVVEGLAQRKMSELRRTIELRSDRGLDAALGVVETGEGRQLMDALRTEIFDLRAQLRRELGEEHRRGLRAALLTEGAELALAGLALLMLAAVAMTRRRTIARQAQAIADMSQTLVAAEFDRLSVGALLDALPVGVFMADKDGRLLRINTEATRIWGGAPPASDIPGYSAYRARWAEDGRPLAAEDWGTARALRTGESSIGEVIDIERFDGGTARIVNSAAPVRNSGGQLLGAVAVLQDITAQQRVERALRQREELLRLFIETVPAAVAMLDRDMRYLAVSQRFCDDFRLAGRNIIGHSHYEIFPEIPKHWRDIHRRCLAGAVARCSEGEAFVRASGETRWQRWEIRPWHDAAGEIGGIILFNEDITERRRTEMELRESEARLRRVIDEAPLPIMVHAEDGEVVQLNRAWTEASGYSREQIPTIAAWTERAYGAAADRAIAAIREAHDSAKSRYEGGEYTVRVADGSLHPWLFRAAAVGRDQRGRRLLVSMAVDLTERERQQAALRQAQKLEAVGLLTSGIAHDFNNYLTVIVGNLERLEAATAGSAKAARLIAESEAVADRAERLVKQLLGFARQQPLHPEPLDCNKIVQDLQSLLRPALPQSIGLRLDLEPRLWPARADRNQLEAALLNLVVNARDAMPESRGSIVIATSNVTLDQVAGATRALAAGEYVEVSVADSGAGMPPAVVARAFEPFYTTKAEGKGSGLGLSQIYGFAKQSSGTAEIDSREGIGTTVRLLLPRDNGTKDPQA